MIKTQLTEVAEIEIKWNQTVGLNGSILIGNVGNTGRGSMDFESWEGQKHKGEFDKTTEVWECHATFVDTWKIMLFILKPLSN